MYRHMTKHIAVESTQMATCLCLRVRTRTCPLMLVATPHLVVVKGNELIGNKSEEQRLNLNRSWHKGHSHAYNTLFYI